MWNMTGSDLFNLFNYNGVKYLVDLFNSVRLCKGSGLAPGQHLTMIWIWIKLFIQNQVHRDINIFKCEILEWKS